MFTGSYTALITPFKEGKINKVAFEALVERQIKQKTHGLVPSGTTGESPTLDHKEHNYIIELCVKIANGRILVLAGTGSNSTAEAVMMTQHAQKVGADGALIVVPYYNKPTQEGLYQHFKAIHDVTDIPIILYNIPGRSVVDMKDDTILRLAELPRIAGIKDATGDLSRPVSLIKRGIKDSFVQLCGDDANALEFNAVGGCGCISVSSNIVPKPCAEMQGQWLAGNKAQAQKIMNELLPLHNILFCETSPGPVKYAASLMDLCSEEMRLPLVPPSDENKAKIRSVLEKLKLI